ncbi:Glucosamine-6-phosphate deaminase [Mucinivorans hirudinis]|uniref:Glucosamine-6-phosphate deaminase n=1 Tax=Mucinivorans hirudinis TaxID=1433126 RepID=A0A060R657_9BACT|nr:Glucosamine-6-phosphate deaminase [Mucinivorans hirudinis]
MSNYKLKSDGGLKRGAEPIDIITRFERIPTHIAETSEEGARHVARQIAEIIRDRSMQGLHCNLALSSGKSPVGVYRELVRMHNEESLSFKNVEIFTVFEFYPVGESEHQSHTHTLKEEFLMQVDIPLENIHILNGKVASNDVTTYCRNYETMIRKKGGIDALLLGFGDEGQIALNESGTYPNTRTRVVALSNKSRKYASSMFYGVENTPTKALTMGIGTILSARKVFVVGWGENKSIAFAKVIEGNIDSAVPGSYLQEHNNIEITIDEDAASLLTRVNTPWLVGTCIWTNRFIRKAVLWLCQQVGKPILKLTYQDYIDHYLGQMIDDTGSTYDKINIQVFNDLQHTISGWPGGKPNGDDTTRPARSSPYPKRVVIFSPHPDDDVISMGGTFLRLADQGHDVHVAYQTSGNIAVHDDVVIQIVDSARECGFEDRYGEICELVASKKKGQAEPFALRQLKGSIRRAEAKAACRHFGINDRTNVHFLNLPFYETGSVKKGAVGQADIDIVVDLLRRVQPHQIYAAGDLSDPHGTHRVCIEAVLAALKQIIEDGDEWLNDCVMWLYRGAWQEWDLDMVDMAVPLSPDEVIKKRHAIYRHLSQKDIVPFPGDDKREFWQRAEDRTQATAQLYDKLGMAEYQAIEVFVKYDVYHQ